MFLIKLQQKWSVTDIPEGVFGIVLHPTSYTPSC